MLNTFLMFLKAVWYNKILETGDIKIGFISYLNSFCFKIDLCNHKCLCLVLFNAFSAAVY